MNVQTSPNRHYRPSTAALFPCPISLQTGRSAVPPLATHILQRMSDRPDW